jgi:hypothetical protein
MAWFDRPRHLPRRHRPAFDPKQCVAAGRCVCPTCERNRVVWLARIAEDRMKGTTLWQIVLIGPALAEPLLLVTPDPERCADALSGGRINVPKPRPERPMFIGFAPFPPDREWSQHGDLAAVRTLPRDTPLTADDLRRHGLRVHECLSKSGRSAREPGEEG